MNMLVATAVSDTGRRQDGLLRDRPGSPQSSCASVARARGARQPDRLPAVTVLVLAGVFGSDPDPDFGGVIPSEHYVVGYVGVVLASLGLVTLPAHLASHHRGSACCGATAPPGSTRGR